MFLCISLDKTANVKGLHIDDNINSPNVHLHAHFDFNFKKYEKIYMFSNQTVSHLNRSLKNARIM